jgi:hypothetical protein
MVPEVLVRSGPSPEFYPTSRLYRGNKVRVVRQEATGWLAIEPPPGSFSYIEARLVEWIARNAAVVTAPEAQIWVASELVHSRPTAWRTKVKRGTQVTVTGKIQQRPSDAWLSILPVPSEVRYIPAEAIQPPKAQQEFVAAPTEPNKSSATPARFAPPDKGAAAFASVSPSPSPTSQATVNSTASVAKTRLVPALSGTSTGMAVPRVSSEYCYQPDSGYTARLSPSIASVPSPPPPSGQWSEPGWLCRTAFQLDGKPLLCLQPLGPNKRHIYVSPGANLDLEPYVNRNVYLYGTMVYNGDLRTYYMTVLQVRLIR